VLVLVLVLVRLLPKIYYFETTTFIIVLIKQGCIVLESRMLCEFAKVQELNDMTRLEVDKLRAQLAGAEVERQRLEYEYAAHTTSTSELKLADSAFLQQQVQGAGGSGQFVARAAAGAALPRSLRTRAADVQHATARERLLRERLQLLLGIRNGACPDDRAARKLTLHCKRVDSVEGHGVAELRGWLCDHCRTLPFMGEMISSIWTAIADVFKHFGDSVLSRCDAITLARQHLPPLKYNLNVSDDEIWSIIEFWSLVGRIFVHEGQVVRDPSTLIALLKPLLHHQPLQMMKLPVYHSLLVEASLQRADARVELSSLLNRLDRLIHNRVSKNKCSRGRTFICTGVVSSCLVIFWRWDRRRRFVTCATS
jgi:hypothetical protein